MIFLFSKTSEKMNKTLNIFFLFTLIAVCLCYQIENETNDDVSVDDLITDKSGKWNDQHEHHHKHKNHWNRYHHHEHKQKHHHHEHPDKHDHMKPEHPPMKPEHPN